MKEKSAVSSQQSAVHQLISSSTHQLISSLLFVIITTTGFSQEIMTLPRAIETGLKNNFSIILQKNSEEISKNNNTLGNAGFLPVLGLTGTQNNTYSTTHQKTFTGTTRDITNARNNTLSVLCQSP